MGFQYRESFSWCAIFAVRQKFPSSFSVTSIRFFTTVWKTFVVGRLAPAPMEYSASICLQKRVPSSSAGPTPRDSILFFCYLLPADRIGCGLWLEEVEDSSITFLRPVSLARAKHSITGYARKSREYVRLRRCPSESVLEYRLPSRLPGSPALRTPRWSAAH